MVAAPVLAESRPACSRISSVNEPQMRSCTCRGRLHSEQAAAAVSRHAVQVRVVRPIQRRDGAWRASFLRRRQQGPIREHDEALWRRVLQRRRVPHSLLSWVHASGGVYAVEAVTELPPEAGARHCEVEQGVQGVRRRLQTRTASDVRRRALAALESLVLLARPCASIYEMD